MKLQVYIFSVLTQKIDTIFEQFILNLLNSINMFYWCQVKPFENLWILNLYKLNLYSWNFSRKIEPCSLPVENGSAKCGLQCEAVEDPHLAPHNHATCGLFASFDLEFTGRKGKLVWRLKRNPELLCVCKIFQCQMSSILFHLKYNMQIFKADNPSHRSSLL